MNINVNAKRRGKYSARNDLSVSVNEVIIHYYSRHPSIIKVILNISQVQLFYTLVIEVHYSNIECKLGLNKAFGLRKQSSGIFKCLICKIDYSISREQASKMLPKQPDPHESRFEYKDVKIELRYRYNSNGKVNPIFDKMMPKPNSALSGKASK